MKNKKRVFKIVVMFVVSMAANASGVKNAKIGMVQTDSTGPQYVFFIGGTFTDTKSCPYPNTTPGYTLYKISNTSPNTSNAANGIYASAIAAMTAGLPVEIVGSGVCESGYETIRHILVQQAAGFTY